MLAFGWPVDDGQIHGEFVKHVAGIVECHQECPSRSFDTLYVGNFRAFQSETANKKTLAAEQQPTFGVPWHQGVETPWCSVSSSVVSACQTVDPETIV